MWKGAVGKWSGDEHLAVMERTPTCIQFFIERWKERYKKKFQTKKRSWSVWYTTHSLTAFVNMLVYTSEIICACWMKDESSYPLVPSTILFTHLVKILSKVSVTWPFCDKEPKPKTIKTYHQTNKQTNMVMGIKNQSYIDTFPCLAINNVSLISSFNSAAICILSTCHSTASAISSTCTCLCGRGVICFMTKSMACLWPSESDFESRRAMDTAQSTLA